MKPRAPFPDPLPVVMVVGLAIVLYDAIGALIAWALGWSPWVGALAANLIWPMVVYAVRAAWRRR